MQFRYLAVEYAETRLDPVMPFSSDDAITSGKTLLEED